MRGGGMKDCCVRVEMRGSLRGLSGDGVDDCTGYGSVVARALLAGLRRGSVHQAGCGVVFL